MYTLSINHFLNSWEAMTSSISLNGSNSPLGLRIFRPNRKLEILETKILLVLVRKPKVRMLIRPTQGLRTNRSLGLKPSSLISPTSAFLCFSLYSMQFLKSFFCFRYKFYFLSCNCKPLKAKNITLCLWLCIAQNLTQHLVIFNKYFK